MKKIDLHFENAPSVQHRVTGLRGRAILCPNAGCIKRGRAPAIDTPNGVVLFLNEEQITCIPTEIFSENFRDESGGPIDCSQLPKISNTQALLLTAEYGVNTFQPRQNTENGNAAPSSSPRRRGEGYSLPCARNAYICNGARPRHK